MASDPRSPCLRTPGPATPRPATPRPATPRPARPADAAPADAAPTGDAPADAAPTRDPAAAEPRPWPSRPRIAPCLRWAGSIPPGPARSRRCGRSGPGWGRCWGHCPPPRHRVRSRCRPVWRWCPAAVNRPAAGHSSVRLSWPGPPRTAPAAVSRATRAPACAAAIATCRAWYHMANWPMRRMLRITSGASRTSSMELAPVSRRSGTWPARSGDFAGRCLASCRAGPPRPGMSGTGVDLVSRAHDLLLDNEEDRQRDDGKQSGDDRPFDGRCTAIAAAARRSQPPAKQRSEIFHDSDR